MKFVIAVLLVTVTIAFADESKLSAEQKAKAEGYFKECREQEGVSKEAALALKEGKFDDSDAKIKCFTNCFFEKAGLIDDGKIQPEKVLAKLGPLAGEDNVKKIQEKCDSLKGADKCDTAYQLFKCYHQHKAQF